MGVDTEPCIALAGTTGKLTESVTIRLSAVAKMAELLRCFIMFPSLFNFDELIIGKTGLNGS